MLMEHFLCEATQEGRIMCVEWFANYFRIFKRLLIELRFNVKIFKYEKAFNNYHTTEQFFDASSK